jgi:hypothetical protein
MVVILEPGIKIKRLIAFETLKKPKLPLRNIINTTQILYVRLLFS